MNFSEPPASFGFLDLWHLILLFGLAVVPLTGLVFFVRGIDRRKPSQIVLSVLIPMAYVAVFGFRVYCSLLESEKVLTEENARPSAVLFLTLPSTARQVGYWKDGNTRIAEFTVSEKEFEKVFSRFPLSEISEPVTVRPKIFGDASNVPYRNQISRPTVLVSDGLFYQEREDSGGGIEIVYDRSRSRGYFDWVGR